MCKRFRFLIIFILYFALGVSSASYSQVLNDNDSQNDYHFRAALSACQYMNDANLYFEENNYINAIENYTKALNIIPILDEAYYWRGYAKFNLGYYNDAIDDWEKVLEITPNYFNTQDMIKLAHKKIETLLQNQYNKVNERKIIVAKSPTNTNLNNIPIKEDKIKSEPLINNPTNVITKNNLEKIPAEKQKAKTNNNFNNWIIFIILFFWWLSSLTNSDNSNDNKNSDSSIYKVSSNNVAKVNAKNEKIYQEEDSTWLNRKDDVFEKYSKKCMNCGATKDIHVHHKISLSKGGTNCIENLIPLCKKCHEELHGYEMNDYTSEVKLNNYYGNAISKSKKKSIGYKICNAINHQCQIRIKYKSGKLHSEEITERNILPREILLGFECSNEMVNQSEYDKYKIFLRAFCLLRNEERLFRLDRILDVIDDDEN